MDFREYLRSKILKSSNRILEFGPLVRPTVTKKTHPNVFFADIRSTEEIKRLYTSNDYLESTGLTVDINSVVHIDFVIKDSYKKTFRNIDKFDVVILSHVIEHMPDIIDFFQDIESIISQNGRLVIIYPDAQYCFDHFRNGTSFIDAYDVYLNKENSSKRVFDFVFNVLHENNASFFWNDKNENSILPQNDFKKALSAYEKAADGELPDDTHFWLFSNHQLIKFLYDMDRAGLLNFDIEEFYPTQENNQECMIILKLKKKPGVKTSKYKRFLDETSPSINAINARELSVHLTKLKMELLELKAENKRISGELLSVYNSRRWKYATKIAETKGRFLKK